MAEAVTLGLRSAVGKYVSRGLSESNMSAGSPSGSEASLLSSREGSTASSRRESQCVPSEALQDIMNGAVIQSTPRYIFKAHEMTQEVRDILKHYPETDISLVATDGRLPAHSRVLQVRGGALADKVEHAEQDGEVPVGDMSVEVLREVVRFVYTGSVPAAQTLARDLLPAAHLAGLLGLKERCAEVLVAELDTHNVVELFDLACNCQEERLKQAAAVLFLEKSKDVYDTDEWHASLDTRPAAAMRLVHIAVTKNNLDLHSTTSSSRIVHLIARIYMVAIVPVVGYLLYATVRNRAAAAKQANATDAGAAVAALALGQHSVDDTADDFL